MVTHLFVKRLFLDIDLVITTLKKNVLCRQSLVQQYSCYLCMNKVPNQTPVKHTLWGAHVSFICCHSTAWKHSGAPEWSEIRIRCRLCYLDSCRMAIWMCCGCQKNVCQEFILSSSIHLVLKTTLPRSPWFRMMGSQWASCLRPIQLPKAVQAGCCCTAANDYYAKNNSAQKK